MSSLQYFIAKKLYVVLIIAFVFMGVGAYSLFDGKVPKGWVKVKGTVSSVNSQVSTDSDGSTSTTFTPVVEYQANGRNYRVVSSYSSSNEPSIGSTMTVAYNPVDPLKAKVIDAKSNILIFIATQGVGLILLIFIVYSLIKNRKSFI